MRNLIPVILLLVGAACTPAPSPAKPPSPDGDALTPVAADATVPAEAAPAPPAPTDACAAGEAKLLALGCKDSRGRLIGGPDLHGVGWAIQCRVDLDAGVDLHAICIAAAPSCTAVMACK
jgi:hypothetical protein